MRKRALTPLLPALAPLDWREVYECLLAAGYPDSILPLAPAGPHDYIAGAAPTGFRVSASTPALVTRVDPAGLRWQHQHWIGQYKRALEDAGFDVQTCGAPGGEYLAVHGRILPRRYQEAI